MAELADQLEITNCYLPHPNLTSLDSLIVKMMNSENWNSMGSLSYALHVLHVLLSLFFPFHVLVQLGLLDVVSWSLRLLELPSLCALSLPSCATLPCLQQ